jgi:hypothetical protein
VQEVDPLAVDFGGVLRELVELRLELAPVVAGSPVRPTGTPRSVASQNARTTSCTGRNSTEEATSPPWRSPTCSSATLGRSSASSMGLAEELLVAAHDGKGRAGVGFQLT